MTVQCYMKYAETDGELVEAAISNHTPGTKSRTGMLSL